jgi:serine/threonine-protein kinase RsbW
VAPRKPKTDEPQDWVERTMPTHLEAIRLVEGEIIQRMQVLGYDEDHRFAVRLACEEALVNAMKHGNRMDPTLQVRLRYRVMPDMVEICVSDQGKGFCHTDIPDPTADENLHKPCGRGIMLMRSYMDKVSYGGCGCEVHMVKYRNR